ncbi:hypothetical protein EMCG_01221, partial [[Emmonsia] crescens]
MTGNKYYTDEHALSCRAGPRYSNSKNSWPDRMRPLRVIFMLYILGMTLSKAWPIIVCHMRRKLRVDECALFKTDNIVKQNPVNDRFVGTGIIGWEYSGFYPTSYECTVLTRTLSLVNGDDWYLYLPESIAYLHNSLYVGWLIVFGEFISER